MSITERINHKIQTLSAKILRQEAAQKSSLQAFQAWAAALSVDGIHYGSCVKATEILAKIATGNSELNGLYLQMAHLEILLQEEGS